MMNILSHIQQKGKNFISRQYYNRKKPAFQSSLVKTVLSYPEDSPQVNSVSLTSKAKNTSLHFALVSYSIQLRQKQLSWILAYTSVTKLSTKLKYWMFNLRDG